ncbi:MAG: hypothetical protein ACPGRD_11300, partial [Planktomarina sp.]
HMLTRERRDAPPNVIEWLIGTGVAKMVRYVSEADRKIMSDICVAAWEKDWDEADEIYTEEEYPTPQGGERPRLLMIKCPSPNS